MKKTLSSWIVCFWLCALVLVAHAKDKPNIIIILADDLGYGDISCFNPELPYKTPNLDRMAAEGVRLTQFNTPAPFCAPTRASLLTGRYPFRCGMTANPAPDGGPAADKVALPPSEVTLANLLKKEGYATSCIGKWHLGHYPESLPTQRGFDEYFGIPYSNDMRPVQLLEGVKRAEYPVVQADLTRRYTERAKEFIAKNQKKPFFLYLPHAMPHKPLAASEEFYKKSGKGLYAEVVMELDHQVGELLAFVKAKGLEDNTLVFFTSDNGPWYGGTTAGLRGMKGSSWEGGYRVPFIARWPGKLPAGKQSAQPTVMMDIFATVLKVTGVSAPNGLVIDGKDLWPLLTGADKGPHDYVFGHQGARLATIRDARWKLHVLKANDRRERLESDGRWIDPRGPDGVTIIAPYEQAQPVEYPGLRTGDEAVPMMLFDLQKDPGEQKNVAAQHSDVVTRLKAAYDEMNKAVPAEPAQPKKGGKKK